MVRSTASTEPQPSEKSDENAAFFIKPSGFRPNSLFVGREEELAELHKLLFDKKRRQYGTSAVLVQSMPGGGKTHLARQYVYDHKEDFPGGIFWLRAKSQTELAAGIWDIARKAALKPVLKDEDEKALNNPQEFVKIVRKWLNHRRDWLVVLDGIHFSDTEGFQEFIPDSPRTSLIYTSTEKHASGDHHWMNPQIIKLPLPSAREAQELLLLELDKKQPFQKEDLKHSMELVHSMGLLPVVIHAVAQRLKATDEPLGKFARHYAAEPRLRGLGAYIAVVDQLKVLGAFEALNLVYILCFFSQHIPVEMISLGLRVLDVPVRASEPITGRTLNNTFRILNMFALIDRNDHTSSLHSSQTSNGSRDMLADNLDVLRLHSVVQGFFADTLLADGTLPLWLDRAVRVFCCSYDIANERITRKTNAGLVEDYRLYEIHGIRLQKLMTKHLRKSPELAEAAFMLEGRLAAIKHEIDRRTPESSHFIANERPDAFQTSIFDRTSSSSDTGLDTPFDDNIHPSVLTWGYGSDKLTHESPTSVVYRDADFNRAINLPRAQFAPLPAPDDTGYDSDRESGVTMTVQPSQRTTIPPLESPTSSEWEPVMKKPRHKPAQLDIRDHRTTRVLEKHRYRDSAGAFRAINKNVIDPRLSQDIAQGVLHSPQPQLRGRVSGSSSAQVALAHITKNSPPPARGGGLIRDRSSSIRDVERRKLTAKTPSYAAAAAGTTIEPVSGYREERRSSAEAHEISNTLRPGFQVRRPSHAQTSLQRFEISRSPPTPKSPLTPHPPYPQSQDFINTHSNSDTQIYQIPGRYSQENLSPGPDPFPANNYYRNTGPFPYENIQTIPLSSSPRKRDLPHDYPAWHSQTYSEIIQPAEHAPVQNLSLSSPNIRSPDRLYYPGHPEFSSPANPDGYTSQPMSRDPSGQSTHSNLSVHSAGVVDRNRRRPSLAETEPIPRLPKFSPRIPPTSYQVYEQMRDERDLRDRGTMRKSPRPGFARVVERLDEWTVLGGMENQLPSRRFNPAAPSFSPSQSPLMTYSPSLPPAPTNSMLSNPSNATSAYPFPSQENYPPQIQQAYSHMTPQSSKLHYSPPQPQSTPRSFAINEGEGKQIVAPEMGRTTSGGLRVGRRLIEFGDFPEPVDFDLARERAERSWLERERQSGSSRDDRVEGLGIREVRR